MGFSNAYRIKKRKKEKKKQKNDQCSTGNKVGRKMYGSHSFESRKCVLNPRRIGPADKNQQEVPATYRIPMNKQ